jgi:hypothetical protein
MGLPSVRRRDSLGSVRALLLMHALRIDPFLDRRDHQGVVVPCSEVDGFESLGEGRLVHQFRDVILTVDRLGTDRSREEEQALGSELKSAGDTILNSMASRAPVTQYLTRWRRAAFPWAKRAAAAFDERVIFEAFDTSDRATFLEWGIWDSLFVDGKEVRTGPPPPSYENVRHLIVKRLKKR